MTLTKTPMDGHHELVTPHHRFVPLQVSDELWQFEHLEAFAMRMPLELLPGQATEVDVVVLFTNHCFTRGVEPGEVVNPSMVIMDGNERRVLDKERYELSKLYLPQLILDLSNRHIQVADPTRPNFVTYELPATTPGATPQKYAVFFEVTRDRKRGKRLLLRVQSAYILVNPSKRLQKAIKINFRILLKQQYNKS